MLLTANKEWFEHTESSDEMFNTKREEDFERLAKAWLEANFGDDVIHARADTDEQAFHIHAVIMPRATVQKYGVECRVLQPSIHPLIKNYEAAQDSVGAWFKPLGLTRGEPRKQAIRDVLNNGREPPVNPRHVRPAVWRAKEKKQLAEKAAKLETQEREVLAREEVAQDVIAFADAVSTGAVDENGQAIDANLPKDKSERVSSLPLRKASYGFAAARKAFRAVAKRLRSRAEAEAKREAEEMVAAETAAIKDAEDVIVEIAQLLPLGLRAKVAAVRRKLTVRIIGLDSTARGLARPLRPREGDPQ